MRGTIIIGALLCAAGVAVGCDSQDDERSSCATADVIVRSSYSLLPMTLSAPELEAFVNEHSMAWISAEGTLQREIQEADPDRRAQEEARRRAAEKALALRDAIEQLRESMNQAAEAARQVRQALGEPVDAETAAQNAAAERALTDAASRFEQVRLAHQASLAAAREVVETAAPAIRGDYELAKERYEEAKEGLEREPEPGSPLMSYISLGLSQVRVTREIRGHLETLVLDLAGEDWSDRPEIASDDDVEQRGFGLQRSEVVRIGAEEIDARMREIDWRVQRLESLEATSLPVNESLLEELARAEEAATAYRQACEGLSAP